MSKNPFLSEAIKGGILETQYEVKKEKDGSDKARYGRIHIMDKDQKISIYKDKSFEESLYKLSPPANKIYHYITHHLGKDRDQISLPQKRIMPIANIHSKRTFYNGLEELIDIGLIAKLKGRANMYWINPHIIFNGGRIDFIKNNYGDDSIKILFKIKN